MNENEIKPLSGGSLNTVSDNKQVIDFSSIIGHLELKETILYALSRGLFDDDIKTAYLKSIDYHASKGILILSKPGLGKTEVLRAVERSLINHPLIEVKYHPSSEFQGTTGKNSKMIEKVFESARNTNKSLHIMLLDEIDSIMMKKKGMLNVSERTNSLLAELDGMRDSSKIIVIATTNRIKNVENALLSRFSDIIILHPPNFEERIEFINKYIKPLPLDGIFDLSIMARDTEGYTGRNFRDIGLRAIEKYASSKQPLSIKWLITEVSKYSNRAGLIKQYNIVEDDIECD